MIRLWLTFFIVSALIHFGVTGWRSLNHLEKWSLTKTLGYSIIISMLAVAFLTVVVILF